MAKEHSPGSRGLADPIRRDHSPYCESKGPIIQEGFVFQRIRALQELQAHAMAGNRSHSPMVSCPPRWVRSYEPITPPRLPLRPAVQVPAMTEYQAIKHRWDLMAKERQEAVAEQTSSGAPLRFQARDSQSPSKMMWLGEPHNVISQAVPGTGQDAKLSSSVGQAESYQAYLGRACTTQNEEQTVGKPARYGKTGLEGPDRVLGKTFSSKSFSLSNLRSTNTQGMVRSRLHSKSINPIRGMVALGLESRQDLDADDLRHALPESTQSLTSSIASPTSDRQQQTIKSPTASKDIFRDDVQVPDERAGIRTAEPDEHGPIVPTFEDFDFSSHLSISSHSSISSRHEILGPNPVPVGLADPSAISRSMSPRKTNNNGVHRDYEQELKSQPQLKSVADQLGVLVECGWVEPGRAISQDAESISNQTNDDKTQSRCLSSDPLASRSDTPPCDTYPSEPITDTSSDIHGSLQYDLDKTTPRSFSGMATPQPQDLKMRGIHQSPTKSSPKRSISDIDPKVLATSLSSPTIKRRISAQQQLLHHRINDSREDIELRDLSQGSPQLGGHHSLSRQSESQEKVGSEPNRNNGLAELEQKDLPITGISPTPSPHESIISANRFIQPSSRSTSWLRKGWLKAVLGDRKHGLEGDLSKDTSNSSSALDCQDGTPQAYLPQSKQPSEDGDTVQSLIEATSNDEPKDTTNSTGFSQRHEGLVRGTKPGSTHKQNLFLKHQGYENANGNWNLASPPLRSPIPAMDQELFGGSLEQNPRKRARNSSGYYSRSRSSITNSLLSKRSSNRAAKTSSGTASNVSQPSENSLHCPQPRPFPTSSPRPKLSRTSSTSVLVRVYKADRISTPPLNYAGQRRRSVSKGEEVRQKSTEEEAVHSTLGRQSGLKKVQIIISFDGAEDLVVEATAAGAVVERSWRL